MAKRNRIKRVIAGLTALLIVSAPLPLQEMGLSDFSFGLTASADTANGNCGATGYESDVTWSFDSETGILAISKASDATSGDMADYVASTAGEGTQVPWLSHLNSITSVVIGEGVSKIGNYAFEGCTNLATVTFEGTTTTPPTLGSNVFDSTPTQIKIYVPIEKYSEYKTLFNSYNNTKVFVPTPAITGKTTLAYDGYKQDLNDTAPLLPAGMEFGYQVVSGTGTPVNENGTFTNTAQAKDAGTYTVYYKVLVTGTVEETISEIGSFTATIAKGEVNSIDITIDAPTPGEDLATTATVAEDDAGKYEISNISWTPSGTDGKAGYETAYKVSFTVTPTANYEFPESGLTATINGNSVTPSTTDGGETYTVEHTFNATKKKNTLTFAEKSETYNGSTQEITATAASDYTGAIKYEYFTDADCTNKTTIDNDGAETAGGAPKNAGEYWVKATAPENDDFAAATAIAKLTINKADPTLKDASVSSQNIVIGAYEFVEPTFTGKGSDDDLDGTITYTYNGNTYESYDALVDVLKNAETGGTISYKFVPDDTKNYNTVENGNISFTMAKIDFKVGDEAATPGNALTIDADPTYGETWSDLVSVNSDLKASIGGVESDDDAVFTVAYPGGDASGIPDAGTYQLHVLFTGTINGIKYDKFFAFEGTVDVAKATPTDSLFSFTDPEDFDYDGEGHAQTVTSDIIADDLTFTVKYGADNQGNNLNSTVPKDAGTYYVYADIKNAKNYDTGAVLLYSFEIKKATPTADLFSYTAPTGDALTYTGEAIKPTVSVKENVNLPESSYSIKYSTTQGGTLNATPVNAGTYYVYAVIANDTNYKETNVLLGNYTIAQATPVLSDSTVATQNIFEGTDTFVAPTFDGVDGQTLDGTVAYTIGGVSKTEEEVKTALINANAGSTVTVGYTFTPNDGTNYETISNGTITFNIVDILFKLNDTTVTDSTSGVVTIKENPTYGDTWEQIVTINSGLKAVIGTGEVEGTFSLKVSDTDGSPDAGKKQYQIVFNSNDESFENKVVYTGTVDVAKKTLTVSAGDYKVTKAYDTTNSAGTGSGTLSVSGIVTGDEDKVTVKTGTIGAYSGTDVGSSYKVDVEISLDGTATGNYTLGGVTSIIVPAEITKATQDAPSAPTHSSHDCHSVTLTPNAAYQFSKDGENWQDSNVFTGLTDGETYNFYQRLKETDTHSASAASAALSYQFTAEDHDYSAKTANSDTRATSATCTKKATYYYSCSKCGAVNKSGATFTSGSYASHSYVTVSGTAVAATCGTAGKSADKRCSVCGRTVTGTAIPATGNHDYTSGGICKVCEGLENGKDGFKSASLTLTDGVILNYYLLLSDTALTDTNAYIHFTSAQGLDRKLMLSEGVVDNGRYKFSLELRPDQMSDEITAQVIYSDGSKGNSINYSVQQYVSNVSESDTSAQKLKDLADAMLNFGAFTQLYTGNNTGDLATDVVDYAVNASIGDEYKHKLTSNISDITVKGATLQIGAYTTIRVKYQLAAGADINDFTFKCGDTVLEPEKSGDYYYVYLRNIRPQNLDEMYSFTVSDGTNTTTLEYSAFSYMKNILDNADKYDKNIVNLMNAMYYYNKAADAYNN